MLHRRFFSDEVFLSPYISALVLTLRVLGCGALLRKGASNSILSSSWPNQTYSPILSYWLIVCGYEMSANRRAGLVWPCTRNYTIARPLLRRESTSNQNFLLVLSVLTVLSVRLVSLVCLVPLVCLVSLIRVVILV